MSNPTRAAARTPQRLRELAEEWRKLRTPNGTVKVMLVDSGHGTLPPGYIRRMLQMLQTAKLLPILDP